MNNTTTQNTLTLVGRLLIALLFVPAGFGKIMNFAGTVGYTASGGLPMPELMTAAAIAFELGGGLLLAFGLFTRWSALALAFFTLVATFTFHAFWAAPAGQAMMMQQAFFKNIAVIGGLLTIAAWGAGRWSLDAKRGR